MNIVLSILHRYTNYCSMEPITVHLQLKSSCTRLTTMHDIITHNHYQSAFYLNHLSLSWVEQWTI